MTRPDDGVVDARVVRTRNDVMGTVLDLLVEEGVNAITHAHVAQVAGYSKATLYKHWPTRTSLLREAFSYLGEMPHHAPTGDLRADLIAELGVFRDGMAQRHLHRALVTLAVLVPSIPELAEVRAQIVEDSERVIRGLLGPHLSPSAVDAATLMLCGGSIRAALLHGEVPSNETLADLVDVVLAATRTSAR